MITGNPFVDTGLMVIAIRSGKNVEDLTQEDIKNVIGDGTWLAKANRQLKSFYMVVGNNSSLTNVSNNLSLKKKNKDILKAENDEGMKEYITILKEFANDINNTGDLCEICGEQHVSNVLKNHKKQIGREWFPLAGSLGNDASSFTSCKSPKICSRCLLAIQFLPLGTMILKRKLVCFQSTHTLISQNIVEAIYKYTIERLEGTTEKISAYGQGKNKQYTSDLIKIFGDIQIDKNFYGLSGNISINMWLFSNSGQEPDCEIIEIPNSAVQFLFDVSSETYGKEIENMIQNNSKYDLINCIQNKSEYLGFYPYKNSKLINKGLFELYQNKVLGIPIHVLNLAEWIAAQIKSDKILFDKLIKINPIFNNNYTVLKTKYKMLFINLTEQGLFTLEDYINIFPYSNEHPIQVKEDAYKWIWFYLHQDYSNIEKPHTEGKNMYISTKIITFAKDIFDYYLSEKGIEYIKKSILDKFKTGDIKTKDIQRWFINLSEIKEGYTNEDWDKLCRDQNGEDNIWELQFQLRLEITNLYRINKEKL